MTIVQEIQQDLIGLPEEVLLEIQDFVVFLKTRYAESALRGKEILNPTSEQLLKQSHDEIERGECGSFNDAQQAVQFLRQLTAEMP